MSCGYEGYDFGAWYPDSICIDGYLWDLDSCNEPGGALHGGGNIPCPCCKTKDYLISYNDMKLSGNARQRRKQLRVAIAKVKKWALHQYEPGTFSSANGESND